MDIGIMQMCMDRLEMYCPSPFRPMVQMDIGIVQIYRDKLGMDIHIIQVYWEGCTALFHSVPWYSRTGWT